MAEVEAVTAVAAPAVEARRPVDAITNVAGLEAEVPSYYPPSAPRLRGARGAVAPWWGSPPTRNDKVGVKKCFA